jgi:hypothetical protein
MTLKSRAKFATALRISYISLNVYRKFGLNWGTLVPLCSWCMKVSHSPSCFQSQFVHADRDPTCWMKGQQDVGWWYQVCWFRVKSETSCTWWCRFRIFHWWSQLSVEHHLFPCRVIGTLPEDSRGVQETRCQVRLLPVDSSKFRLSRT